METMGNASIAVKKGEHHVSVHSPCSLTAISHSKSDCTNPRVFKGTCRLCEKEGHPAAECPDKPPVKCFNCKEEGGFDDFLFQALVPNNIVGHATQECTSKRVFDKSGVPNMDADAAWIVLQKADKERDLDDFRTVSRCHTLSVTQFLTVSLGLSSL